MKKLIERKLNEIKEYLQKHETIARERNTLDFIDLALEKGEYNLNEESLRYLISNLMFTAFMNEDNILHLLISDLLTYMTVLTLKGGD